MICRPSQATLSLDSLLSTSTSEGKWERKPIESSPPEQKVWELSSTDFIPQKPDELTLRPLGQIKGSLRFTAIVRLEDYWLGVYSDKHFFNLTEDGVLLIFLTTEGTIVSLLAFNASDDVYTVFRSGPQGEIVVAARNDGKSEAPFQVLMGTGPDHLAAIEAVVSEARKRVHQRPKIQSLESNTSSLPSITNNNSSFIDGLCFCTWNALGQNLTGDKVLNAVNTLSKNNINISTLLIDDNWQTLGPMSLSTDINTCDPFHRGFASIPANSSFPGGLKALVASVRKQHPHIAHVGVWHALFGYWGGIAPNSPLAHTYKTHEVSTNVMGTPATILIIHPQSIHQFYDDFYAYLSSQGIDFVKTDVQHMLSLLTLTSDREAIIPAYQSAWTTAYLKHFSGRAISCMSQQPEILLHSALQTHTPKILMRNSDDFFPEVPGSHTWHIFVNAYNSLLTSELNVVPDWDMFQSKHEGGYSGFHAAARAVSGGPVMITDKPGEHDLQLIGALSAKTVGGRVIGLRMGAGRVSGRNVWERYGDRNVLRIVSKGHGDEGMLGLFNIAEGERHALASLDDFEGLKEGGEYVARSYRTGQVFGPFTEEEGSKMKPEELVQVKLDVKGWELLTAHPVHRVHNSNIAVLGLLEKMSGIAAVTDQSVAVVDGEQSLMLRLKAVGKLGLWIAEKSVVVEAALVRKQVMDKGDEEAVQNWTVLKKNLISEEALPGGSGGGRLVEVDLVGCLDEEKLWGDGSDEEEELVVKIILLSG